jgi:Ras-related protein Rab-1A
MLMSNVLKIFIILMFPTIDQELKIVLVGSSSVGKSSLLFRFIDSKFVESTLSTIGVDFKFRTLTIKNQRVKLQIWDTAGKQ